MANYQEFMHPYAEPGFASNPPVLDHSAYPNSALKSPYPGKPAGSTDSTRNPLASANFKLLKSVAETSRNLTDVFEKVEGEPAIDITKYHAFRKYKKQATSVRQDDRTDLIVQRPNLRSDLIGGEKDIEPFWALMSVVIDLTIEHVSHQLLTGTPFSPEGEVEVFLEKLASKPKFRSYFSSASNTDIMLYFASSALPALGENAQNPAKLWDFETKTMFQNCISAWVCGQVYTFLLIYLADFDQHMTKEVRRIVLEEETCQITPPPGLVHNNTTLPVEKMHFALRLLAQIQFTRIGAVISAEEIAQEVIFLQSLSLFSTTKAMFKKLGLAPIAYMLRKERRSFKIPIEAFAAAAMMVERELCILALSPDNFDLRLEDPGKTSIYNSEDLLKWSRHTYIIEAIKGLPALSLPSTSGSSGSLSPGPTSPSTDTVPHPAMVVLIALQERLEGLCLLERVAADWGQWS